MRLERIRALPHKYWELINKGNRVWTERVLPDVEAVAIPGSGLTSGGSFYVFGRVDEDPRPGRNQYSLRAHSYVYLARTLGGKVVQSRARFVRFNVLNTRGWAKALVSLEKFLTVHEVISS